MSFLVRLASAEPFETWPGMVKAAEQRYWDALALAVSEGGHETGAIYLLGYVAEMLIKTAYCQATGYPAGVDVRPHFRAAQSHAAWLGGNLHNLRSWINYLVDVRRRQGNPLNAVVAGEIIRHVLAVDAHWREALRYTSVPASEAEMEEVFINVEWLRTNYDLLWR